MRASAEVRRRRVGFAARSPRFSLRGRAPSALRPPYAHCAHRKKICAFLLRFVPWFCFPPCVLLTEGRQPVTFGRWSGMRRLRAWASSAWALGRPRRQPSGPIMGFCLQWLDWRLVSGSRKLPCSGRRRADPPRPRKHGAEAKKTPRWSADRRARFRTSARPAPRKRRPHVTITRLSALRPPHGRKRGTIVNPGGKKRLAGGDAILQTLRRAQTLTPRAERPWSSPRRRRCDPSSPA